MPTTHEWLDDINHKINVVFAFLVTVSLFALYLHTHTTTTTTFTVTYPDPENEYTPDAGCTFYVRFVNDTGCKRYVLDPKEKSINHSPTEQTPTVVRGYSQFEYYILEIFLMCSCLTSVMLFYLLYITINCQIIRV